MLRRTLDTRWLALALLLVPGVAGAQIDFKPAASGGVSPATLGPELAPALTAANWTCGAGWDCSVAGTLNKNADGVGTAAPTASLAVTVGVTYKVVITLGAVTVGNGATYLLGPYSPGETALTAATTYTHYVTPTATGNLTITPTPTATRFTITGVSVKAITAGTGGLNVEGVLHAGTPAIFTRLTLNSADPLTPSLQLGLSAGTGFSNSSNSIEVFNTTKTYRFSSSSFQVTTNNGADLGASTLRWRYIYPGYGFVGGETMALTEGSATTFATVACPQTAGANFCGGRVIWQVYESDGTDMTTISGVSMFNAANKAGTETCAAIIDSQTAIVTTQGADTLTCAITCVTGLTDVIGLAANCTDSGSMAQTSLVIKYRFDMPQVNTVVPGT